MNAIWFKESNTRYRLDYPGGFARIWRNSVTGRWRILTCELGDDDRNFPSFSAAREEAERIIIGYHHKVLAALGVKGPCKAVAELLDAAAHAADCMRKMRQGRFQGATSRLDKALKPFSNKPIT